LKLAGALFGENLEYALLGILILSRRSLRTLAPANHVFHQYAPSLG
jgi:hypothetical protein